MTDKIDDQAGAGVTPVAGAASYPLLRGRCVAYFANDWRGENRTSSHHIAQRLARVMPMLYIESPGMRAPDASARDARKIIRKLLATLRRPRLVADGMWLCTVPQLPGRRFGLVRALNKWLTRYLVRRAIKAVKFHDVISWFVVPHPGHMAHLIGDDFVVYYCVDDYAAHPGVDEKMIQRFDDDLTVAADRVFVAPRALLERKLQLNASSLYSPHGVDVAHFARAMDSGSRSSSDSTSGHGPVIGFFGSIASWIDTGLICKTARQRPNYQFVLVGHVSTDVSELSGLPNVKLAGPVPYEELPRVAADFDVAILPYRLNRQVRNANPLKLREYLACGLPVVSMYTPEVQNFSDVVYVATKPDQFVELIDRALREDCEALRCARLASVANMSWDARVDEVLATIEMDLRRQNGMPL